MHALVRRLATHRDFEAIEAIMNVFLRLHADVLITNGELKKGLEELEEAQKTESRRVLELISSSLGTLGFVRDTL
jgi:U3 small nucleolar RNA-associated protein 21